MLTRIFATSKPLNFLWVSLLLFLSLSLDWFYTAGRGFGLMSLLEYAGILGLLIFSVLLVDFIVRKNDLSQKNTFVVFFYGCLLSLLPFAELGLVGIAAHVLVLMAFRRIIALQSLKTVKKKIFDAAFWIAIASFLWFAAGGMIVLVFLGILIFDRQDYRNWLVPIFGIATVFLIGFTAYWLIYDQTMSLNFWSDWKLDFSEWTALNTAWKALFFFILSAVLLLTYWLSYRKIMLLRKRKPLLVALTAIVSWLVAFFVQPIQTGSLVFLMFPLAVMASRPCESNAQRPITELLLWLFLLLPFAARTVI